MATAPPGYGKVQYWDERYREQDETYDWLNHADILDGDLDQALKACKNASPRILHIGCGNSELSFNLRLKVRDPSQIHNVDYSRVVIEWGRATERSMFDSRYEDDNDGSSSASAAAEPIMPMMKWDEVDLLSLTSVISTCPLGAYAIVLDKSTCDALACTSTIELSFPYFLYADKVDDGSFLDISKSFKGSANAVQVMAMHLALVSAPKAKWIAYSYSSTRFWFLDPDYVEQDEAHSPVELHPGIPHPKDLWTLVEHRAVMRPYGTPGETTSSNAGNTHFVYIMERTDTALNVRTMQRQGQSS